MTREQTLDAERLLNERESTHGSFSDNARISQGFKTLYRSCPGWDRMTPIQREALDNIALKLSRILSGQAHEPDHFRDVAGYAQLAIRELQK